MKLQAYKGRDKQVFLQILQQAISEGITDIRLLQKKLLDDFHEDIKRGRLSMSKDARISALRAKKALKEINIDSNTKKPICPECNSLQVNEIAINNLLSFKDGVEEREVGKVLQCKKCRWSELVQYSTVTIRKER